MTDQELLEKRMSEAWDAALTPLGKALINERTEITRVERERCLLIVHRARAEVDALAENADPFQRFADDWLAVVEDYIRDPSLEWKE